MQNLGYSIGYKGRGDSDKAVASFCQRITGHLECGPSEHFSDEPSAADTCGGLSNNVQRQPFGEPGISCRRGDAESDGQMDERERKSVVETGF